MIETAQGDSQAIAAATLELRRASPDDRELLAGMYRTFEPKAAAQGLPPRHDPERWLAGLSVYPNFLAIVGGRLAGHSVLCSDGETAEIAVFVHQDFRGRGLGKRLLAEMVHEARRLGLRRVWGVTDLDNVPMLRLARALGFVPGRDPREFYLNLHAESHVAAT
jgi:RimJ/RimL family protein N-acetyltransferase